MGKSVVDMGLAAYGLAWKAVLPLLKLNPRLKDGWAKRTLSEGMPAPAHLWIQAASGGEAYLAWEVLKHLSSPFPETLRILVTTNTRQGFDTLARAAEDIHTRQPGLAVQPWYFPFDAPQLMQRLAERVRPRLALILETEIWPGFLHACQRQGVPVLLANGRMTTKSLGGYLAWPGLFRSLAPDLVMAVSERDGRRFGTLFGKDRVRVMPNIKFDRMADAGPMARADNPLRDLIREDAEFVILGSMRRQEASDGSRLAAGLLAARPKAILGLFPRHMHHLPIWQKALEERGLNWVLRSGLNGPAEPGKVILWDTFGELVPAYGLAGAAFVGGSLAPLGGQNFLEPLTCGVTPVTGPPRKNFPRVGREIVDSGLAVEAMEWRDALESLNNILDNPRPQDTVAAEASQYIRDRRGGAEAVCKQVADFLNKD